jgi:hypothetical protein
LALLVPWDAAASADRAIDVLRDGARGQALLAGVREAARDFTWDTAASRILAAYEEAALVPARTAGGVAYEALRLEEERARWEARYWHLHNLGDGTAMSLINPDCGLPDNAQRALSAMLNRRMTRGLLLAALKTIHRVATVGRSG